MIYSWALVLWIGSFDNYTIHDKFQNVDDCIDNQARLTRALNSVSSPVKAVCRPIAK
jgi:hypothetical protein